LGLSVLLAGSGPIFFADVPKIAEVLAPACAACKFSFLKIARDSWIHHGNASFTQLIPT